MPPDPARLALLISRETGLGFVGRRADEGDARILSFVPGGYERQHTFSIIARLKFRRFELEFQPGPYAGDLLEAMSQADESARLLFWTVLADSEQNGAAVTVRVDDIPVTRNDADIWGRRWRRFQAGLSRGNVDIGPGDGAPDGDILAPWLLRFSAAMAALLPLEALPGELPNPEGLPEGAVQRVEVNRYERDRRNRAAALAIHGYACKACDMRFGTMYGDLGAGFIEVHHITPVSALGQNYVVNPATDLAPLCCNCHSMVHQRTPPLAVDELRSIIRARLR